MGPKATILSPRSAAATDKGGLRGIFVPIAEEGLDELEALVDARKTLDAEISRHRRLAQTRPKQAPEPTGGGQPLELDGASGTDDGTPQLLDEEDDEAQQQDPAAATEAAAASAASSRKRARPEASPEEAEEDEESSASAAPADLSFASLDLVSDCFTVVNNNTEAYALDGCVVQSTSGGQEYPNLY